MTPGPATAATHARHCSSASRSPPACPPRCQSRAAPGPGHHRSLAASSSAQESRQECDVARLPSACGSGSKLTTVEQQSFVGSQLQSGRQNGRGSQCEEDREYGEGSSSARECHERWLGVYLSCGTPPQECRERPRDSDVGADVQPQEQRARVRDSVRREKDCRRKVVDRDRRQRTDSRGAPAPSTVEQLRRPIPGPCDDSHRNTDQEQADEDDRADGAHNLPPLQATPRDLDHGQDQPTARTGIAGFASAIVRTAAASARVAPSRDRPSSHAAGVDLGLLVAGGERARTAPARWRVSR